MFSLVSAICLLGFVAARYIQPPPPPPPPFGLDPVIFPPYAPKPLKSEPLPQPLIPDPFATWPWDHPAPSPPQPAPWPFVQVVPTPPENPIPNAPSTGFPSPIEYPRNPKPEILPNFY